MVLFTTLGFAQKLNTDTYSVGFKFFEAVDNSREYLIGEDTISRPLLIHLWYPSTEKVSEKGMIFKDYIDLISKREKFDTSQEEIDKNSFNFINAYAGFAKQRLGLDTNITTQQILNQNVIAKSGIALAKANQNFSLIIYAPSNSKSAVQNHILCEYLASAGYLVAAVGSAGKNSLKRGNNAESILAQVEDMEFVLHYIEDVLKIRYSNLGLMAFSSGGLATSIFQMNHKDVKAVLSLDGGQDYGAYNVLFEMDEFNLNRTSIPYCLLHNNYPNFSVFPYYNSIKSREKYIYNMPYLDHNGFVSYWHFFNICSAEAQESKVSQSYDIICATSLSFFDVFLKAKNKQKSNGKFIVKSNEFIEKDTSEYLELTELANLILLNKEEEAIQILYDHQKSFIKQEMGINILSKLIRDSNKDAAIELLLFNTQMHPNSWQAYYELGFTYKLNDNYTMARKNLLKAQELNSENSEIAKLLNDIGKNENK